MDRKLLVPHRLKLDLDLDLNIDLDLNFSGDLSSVPLGLLHLSLTSQTAELWLLYMDYVKTLRRHIRAARTSDWNLNLTTLKDMVNIFAATGHINYAKSSRFYLQLMLELQVTHPWLYSQLSEHGHHFIRRTEKYWAGLWPDLVIEQVMMKSIKSRGGLTRGRGMSEAVCRLWLGQCIMQSYFTMQ